jgi:N6-adenosine-specific RNA methylase IME4
VPLDTERPAPILYADPPWRYEHVKTESRAIENQYPTLSLEEICALPVAAAATSDAVLFLWATSPKLAEAFQALDAWGFTYRTCMVWAKNKIGMGYYARQQHELLLIATKGEPPVPLPENRPSSVVHAERGEHSKKPEIFYDLIERMYPEFEKNELFLRGPARKGWRGWGNQAE